MEGDVYEDGGGGEGGGLLGRGEEVVTKGKHKRETEGAELLGDLRGTTCDLANVLEPLPQSELVELWSRDGNKASFVTFST